MFISVTSVGLFCKETAAINTDKITQSLTTRVEYSAVCVPTAKYRPNEKVCTSIVRSRYCNRFSFMFTARILYGAFPFVWCTVNVTFRKLALLPSSGKISIIKYVLYIRGVKTSSIWCTQAKKLCNIISPDDRWGVSSRNVVNQDVHPDDGQIWRNIPILYPTVEIHITVWFCLLNWFCELFGSHSRKNRSVRQF